MRDISEKIKTLRTATAQASLRLNPQTVEMVQAKRIPKGDPLEVAKVAAVQAAKNTHQIIPYCHPLPIDHIEVDYNITERAIDVTVVVKAIYKTGVEMEALTAASVAVLTLYDMMKMLDDDMEILGAKLHSKRGGKSDFTKAAETSLRAAVLVISDSVAAGTRQDRSGPLIVERLQREGIAVTALDISSDDAASVKSRLKRFADDQALDLVLTTGGTGCGPRDNTPEAMSAVIEREIPGIPEALRGYGQERTPFAMLARTKAGIRGRTLIVNLPGSPKE